MQDRDRVAADLSGRVRGASKFLHPASFYARPHSRVDRCPSVSNREPTCSAEELCRWPGVGTLCRRTRGVRGLLRES